MELAKEALISEELHGTPQNGTEEPELNQREPQGLCLSLSLSRVSLTDQLKALLIHQQMSLTTVVNLKHRLLVTPTLSLIQIGRAHV